MQRMRGTCRVACQLGGRRTLKTVVGTAPTFFDVRRAVIGQNLDIPYELTVTDGWSELWQSSFFQHDRLYTSAPFAKKLGFQQHLLPFSFMCYKATSMSHIDAHLEVMDVGLENAVYMRPGYVGDTFTKSFYIKRLRETAKGATVVTVRCLLLNQHEELCFAVDKVMLWPVETKQPFMREPAKPPAPLESTILDQLQRNLSALPRAPSLCPLSVGELLLHEGARPLGEQSLALGTLFRQTHPLNHDPNRAGGQGLVVQGPLVLALGMAVANRTLYEVLYEELQHSRFLNKVAPTDTVSAVSFVNDITPLGEGLEDVRLTTIGLKNVDVLGELSGVALPVDIFEQPMRKSMLEDFMKENCPLLQDRIVFQAVRRLVRQAPHDAGSLLPTL